MNKTPNKFILGLLFSIATFLTAFSIANAAALVSFGTPGVLGGSISLAGLTSGLITLDVPSVAGTNTITFPATTGTVVTTGDSGTVTNSMLAGGITVANGGTGASTLTSHGVLIGSGTNAINATSAGTAGQVLTSNGASADPTFQAVPSTSPMILLKGNSGTSTSSTAANVDTVSISGLTSLDTVAVYYTASSVGGNTTSLSFYNSTDGFVLEQAADGNSLSSGQITAGQANLSQDQASNTTIIGTDMNQQQVAIGNGSSASQTGLVNSKTVTTPWTSNWTLALRQGGVSGGGTLHWSWRVYKIAGQ